MSLDDVEFPDASLEVKEEEGEDYELPEGNLSRDIDNKAIRRYVGNLKFFTHGLFSIMRSLLRKQNGSKLHFLS